MQFDKTIGSSSLPAMLRVRASDMPDALAFMRLDDGEREGASLTFGELDRRASSIARQLVTQGYQNDRALLVYPQGLEFIEAFFGCLYAGVVAIPVPAPDPARLGRALARLSGVVEDARPRICLTTEEVRAAAAPLLHDNPAMAQMEWLSVDPKEGRGVDGASPGRYMDDRSPEDLAYLQYTSGSTSTPKGVLMSHANVFANLRVIEEGYGGHEGDRTVTWLPQFHDLGLIFGMIWPIAAGFTTYVMSPMEFIAKPFRWPQAMSKYSARVSGGPNFAYELCVTKSTAEQRASLDLSNWKVALNGAEPVRWASLDAFADGYAVAGFRISQGRSGR